MSYRTVSNHPHVDIFIRNHIISNFHFSAKNLHFTRKAIFDYTKKIKLPHILIHAILILFSPSIRVPLLLRVTTTVVTLIVFLLAKKFSFLPFSLLLFFFFRSPAIWSRLRKNYWTVFFVNLMTYWPSSCALQIELWEWPWPWAFPWGDKGHSFNVSYISVTVYLIWTNNSLKCSGYLWKNIFFFDKISTTNPCWVMRIVYENA